MNRTAHYVVGLIEIDARESAAPHAGDETLAAALARLAVCASADLRAEQVDESENGDDLDEHLDYEREDSPLVGDPLRDATDAEPLATDLPRLLCELNLLYAMVRGEALLRRFAR